MAADRQAEIAASVAALKDLGPGYDQALAEGLVERIGAEIDKRIAAEIDNRVTAEVDSRILTEVTKLVKVAIREIEKDTLEIRPGLSKIMKVMSRIAPELVVNVISRPLRAMLAQTSGTAQSTVEAEHNNLRSDCLQKATANDNLG